MKCVICFEQKCLCKFKITASDKDKIKVENMKRRFHAVKVKRLK